MKTTFAWIAAIMIFAVGASAADSAGPSFDCDMARTVIEKQICGSPEVAALDRTVAERYDALGKEIRSKALRNRIVQDQRDWLKDRDARGEKAGPTEREASLRDAYQNRRPQLDFYRAVFLGPPLPHPLKLGCDQSAGSQVEIRRCLYERSNYIDRTLKIATEAAPVEMRELDTITSADIGAEKAFEKSRLAYGSYRDAACSAVAASYAGGSGSGIAMLSCQQQLDWERANRIASQFLFRQRYWSEDPTGLTAPIRACLKAVEDKGPDTYPDPRVTGIREMEDGGQRIRIAAGDAWRGECATTADWTVKAVTALDGSDVWPGEGLAVFYPKGSRMGTARLEQPPYDPCSLYRWVTARNGDLSGWIQLSLCR